MKKLLFCLVLLTINVYTNFAQDKTAIKFSHIINKNNAFKHLSVLASDEYEGRKTGEKGGWMAANYIANHFKAIGLNGPINEGYLQPVEISDYHFKQNLVANGQPIEALKDFYIEPRTVPLKGVSIKITNIFLPAFKESDEGFQVLGNEVLKDKTVLVFSDQNNGEVNDRAKMSSMDRKIKYLTNINVSVILVVDSTVSNMPDYLKKHVMVENQIMKTKENIERMNRHTPVVIKISLKLADQIFKSSGISLERVENELLKAKSFRGKEFATNIIVEASKVETKIKTENVLGYLEGSDPLLKNELLVISAHYDHLGITPDAVGNDKINNGADDDGSGTTGVLMLAEAFANAKKAGRGPKRSILFIAFTGEEAGLIGSNWYSLNPTFPLTNTVTNLNIDMIGRGDKEHIADKNFVYIIGSDMLSSDLDHIVKKANSVYTKMNLDERYNSRTDQTRFYYRSDHYNFAKHRIPVIFFFNGIHEDYHQPSDEIDKIDFPMLAKRSKLVYFTAWELANKVQRPVVDKD